MPTEEITRDLLGQELEQAEAEAEADGELGRVQVSEEDIVVHTGSEGVGGGGLISKDQSINLAPVGPGDDSGLDDERNNRDTVDDPSAQRLTWAEIEELKRKGGGSSGRVSRGFFVFFSSFFHSSFPLLFSFSSFFFTLLFFVFQKTCIETRIPRLIFWLGCVYVYVHAG